MATKEIEFDVIAEKRPNGSEALAGAQPMNIIDAVQQRIVSGDLSVDVLERLLAMRDRELSRRAEAEFNDALNAAQAEIGRIAPDLENPQTRSKYASYAPLDRIVRPIYLKHGFSLSFDEGEFLGPDSVQVVCYVSHKGGHTRKYHKNLPADGKGAKGGDVMTKTHASAAADSYGMRYLLKKIFNIAVGEDDTDGNLDNGWVAERVEWINNCRDVAELQRVFAAAYKEAKAGNSNAAMKVLVEAKDRRKAELQ